MWQNNTKEQTTELSHTWNNSEKRQEMRTNLIIFMIIKEEELKNWTASSQAGQHWQILDDWAVNFP